MMELISPSEEQVRMYYEMIKHMPVGVAIWRLEKTHKNVLRLVCSNAQASQYVGVQLQVGRPIHEILPNGGEVHRFLEEVVRSQRVSSLEKFRTFGHDVAVTAFPLHMEYVAVVLEPPKAANKEEWVTSLDATGVAVAVCEGTRALHCNEPFASMLGTRMNELAAVDIFLLLEQRCRHSRGVEELRRSIREARIHQVEVELEQRKWRITTQPIMDAGKRSILVAYRMAALPSHQSTFPILPHIRETLPIPPKPPVIALDGVYADLVESFPSPIVLTKVERSQDKLYFRIVALNKVARQLSKHLVSGKSFDEFNPSPFDPSFVRLLGASSHERDGRVIERCSLIGNHSTFLARTIPLREFVGISFEEYKSSQNTSTSSSSASVAPIKRPYAEMDQSHPVLPSPKHSRPLTAPLDPSSTTSLSSYSSFSQLPPPLLRSSFESNDIVLPFGNNLPKPVLPPMQAQSASASDLLGGSERDRLENRIIKNCVIAIACTDMNGKFTSMNRAFSQTIGYPEQDLLERPFFAFLHPEDAETTKGLLHQLACGDVPSYDVPIRLLNKRMNMAWALASFLLNRNTQGEPTAIVLQLQQPARMKHYPEVLLSDHDVLRSTFRELAVGSAVLDASSSSSAAASPKIVSANTAFCSVLGSTVSEIELTGHALVDVIYQEDRDKVAKAIREMLSTRILRHQMSVRTLPKLGPPAWAALSLAAILDSKSMPLLLVAQLQLVDKPFP